MPALRPLAAALAIACTTAQAVEVKYVLWDSNQLPAYSQCAADFTKKNPGITVKISQSGWGDYWTSLSTGFVSGTAPDVFTNHLAKYPELARNGQVLDLAPFIARDKLDTSLYAKGLVQIWGRDGKQYGLPKDWDTVAFIVNMAHAKKAGVTLAELQEMTWNPKDGGSFEQVARKLTLDSKGRNANDPAFDKKSVAVYGYQTPAGGNMGGQTTFSFFAVPNGFKYQDQPWAGKYYYDDLKLAETLDWMASLHTKGISAPYQNTKSLGTDAMFVAGKVAMVPQGSWMMTYFAANAKFENAWVPLPKGPNGQRASMLNGLADSIWSGSKVKEEAWKWVRYLGSPDCQNVVAATGVVFPAINGMGEKAVAAQKARGIDASAFLTVSKENTFLMPIADHGAQVDEIIAPALEAVLLGKPAGPTLKAASDKANRLFK